MQPFGLLFKKQIQITFGQTKRFGKIFGSCPLKLKKTSSSFSQLKQYDSLVEMDICILTADTVLHKHELILNLLYGKSEDGNQNPSGPLLHEYLHFVIMA